MDPSTSTGESRSEGLDHQVQITPRPTSGTRTAASVPAKVEAGSAIRSPMDGRIAQGAAVFLAWNRKARQPRQVQQADDDRAGDDTEGQDAVPLRRATKSSDRRRRGHDVQPPVVAVDEGAEQDHGPDSVAPAAIAGGPHGHGDADHGETADEGVHPGLGREPGEERVGGGE